MKRWMRVLAALLAVVLLGGCSGALQPCSQRILGEWYGEVDIAPLLFQELEEELGAPLKQVPVYVGVYMRFEPEGEYRLRVDTDSVVDALTQIITPFADIFFGMDTEALTELLLEYGVLESGAAEKTESGWYTVDDATGEVRLEEQGDMQVYLEQNALVFYNMMGDGAETVFTKDGQRETVRAGQGDRDGQGRGEQERGERTQRGDRG